MKTFPYPFFIVNFNLQINFLCKLKLKKMGIEMTCSKYKPPEGEESNNIKIII